MYTYSKFSTYKCELFKPLEGQLKEGSQVTIYCRIADALSVRLILDDSKWLSEDRYDKVIKHFKRTITVPKRKITVIVKNEKASNYKKILLYTVFFIIRMIFISILNKYSLISNSPESQKTKVEVKFTRVV